MTTKTTKTSMTALSIIVPIYNKEAYIDLCIESILKQTFTDFELLLINDGSTDACAARCQYYAERDDRITVIYQDNQGVSAARNKGLQMAQGSYVGFVDCDDTLEADMYEVLLDTAKKYGSDITICGVRKIFQDKIELQYGSLNITEYNRHEAVAGLLQKEFPRSVYDKIYKAEIAKSIKFEGRIYEDTFYNFLALSKTKKVVFNDVVKYNYIVRDNSVSMEKFSKKYLDSTDFSKRIVEQCRREMPDLVVKAQYFDLITNISLVNLLLVDQKDNYPVEYQSIVAYLKGYLQYVRENPVKRKHKYAIYILGISPLIYEIFMKIYCKITDADLSKKRR
jgi:glycosyltransferase involved in cell wall biosynthesis